MRKITIIGAGQSGLQLGIGLLQKGYEVKLVTNKTAEEVAQGRILSSQCMFDMALQNERDLHLNYFDEDCPWVEGIGFKIKDTPIAWQHRLDKPAQSVDQRVKMPVWMNAFVEQGGDLLIQDVDVSDLDRLSKECDLLLVASGKGDIGKMFERDALRSSFDKPMRALGLTYVKGMKPREDFSAVDFNLIPGVGEYFSFPALSTSGPCDIMVFEGVPGGPMDCWQGVDSPDQHLQVSKAIIAEFVPQDMDRIRDIELTDDNGILAGRFPPTIRHPIGRLPSGGIAYGIADTVCLNDPITGQGSNNASKCAAIHLASILAQGEQAFDEQWMLKTFDKYWSYAQWVVSWTNALLLPPTEKMVQVLAACGEDSVLAQRFVNGFDDPRDYYPWFMEPNQVDVAGNWA
ncbi:styrene monooxygenase/indole monooxygenase family protein [Pseudoteredinibacter isoporae]|uniref:styrene monooxygenase/indole monooxygenase family protein n=1 Tax=Pseudoteredinibacter isoporae TaxID=570281 RepID=UPI003105F32F